MICEMMICDVILYVYW